jgi:hypothetical protein
LLSRWETVSCVLFVNVLFAALFHPPTERSLSSYGFVALIVTLNTVLLLTLGLATVTSPERLKAWWRERSNYRLTLFAENGLPWAWLALSAVSAYAVMAFGLVYWKSALNWEPVTFGRGAIQLLIVSLFVTRDVLFIQRCRLSRMRAPIVKGVSYLILYYAAAGAIAIGIAVNSENAAQTVVNILTPTSAFDSSVNGNFLTPSIFVGIALQILLIWVVVTSITTKLGSSTRSLIPAHE